MRITALELGGIGRFSADIEIPIAELDATGARLVAICGDNGEGKTTALESIPAALYRSMPSRGAVGRMANRRDSFVRLGIEVDGDQLTARLLIDGNRKSPRVEAYLDADGAALCEGKIKDYKAAIAARFPSEAVYLSSAFAAQGGGGSFLTIPRTDRKGLFVEMLGAGRLERLAKAASDRAKALEPKIEAKRAAAAAATELAGSIPTLEADEAAVEIQHRGAADDLALAETRAQEAAEALERWNHTARGHSAAVSDARSAEGRARDQLGFAEQKIADLGEALEGHRKELARLKTRDKDRETLEAMAGTDEGVEGALRNIEGDIRDHRAAEEAHRVELKTWTEARQKAAATYVEIRARWASDQQDAARAIEAAAEAMARAEDAARRLAEVPCRGEGEYSGCPLISAALDAFNASDDLVLRYQDAKAAAKALEDQPAELAEAEAAGKALGPEPTPPDPEEYRALEVAAGECRDTIQRASNARVALEALDADREQIEQIEVKIAETLEASEKARAAAEAALADADKATNVREAASRASDQHGAAKPEKPDDRDVRHLRELESSLTGRLASAKQRLDSARAAELTAANAQSEIDAMLADLDDWQHLARAFGRNGIQALEIDAAGPEVSQIANELLHACYGSRFSLSLETQAISADGKKQKETFDLRVIDSERGTEGDAGDLSGGEKVLVGESLALAIAIFNSRRSSIPMADLFRDEVAGALSSANATRYIEMLRRALDLGGFHRCYFIAHQQELWALADAEIVFADGGCRLGG